MNDAAEPMKAGRRSLCLVSLSSFSRFSVFLFFSTLPCISPLPLASNTSPGHNQGRGFCQFWLGRI